MDNSKCAVCKSRPCTCSRYDTKELLFDQCDNLNHGAFIAITGRVLDSAVASLRFLGIPAILASAGDVWKIEDEVLRVVKSTVNLKHFGRLDAGSFLVPFEDLAPNGFLLFV